ncbi:S26 family signal peptidase [Methylocystis sp. MJC1]|uniref:S26 family signal peptidase n=1 Tax=Methylocystis sp. MJC1 TaxID=2654282 RepID=UPI002B4003A5|nr:S26 family signal peptidase [Methylocystis sp. MJC1]
MPGQKVCRGDRMISVDGSVVAEANACDHAGCDLPRWNGCFTLLPGEIFLLNWDRPASLDGRYFLAFPVKAIVGRKAHLDRRGTTDNQSILLRQAKRAHNESGPTGEFAGDCRGLAPRPDGYPRAGRNVTPRTYGA